MTRFRTTSLIALFLLLGLNASVACSRKLDSASANPWTVVTIRERRSGEIPFEESSNYLRRPSNANYVPGPDSLVARVVNDANRRPHILVSKLGTGEVDSLFGGIASLPQWSPDGRYISCVVWKSRRISHQLAVIEVGTRKIIVDSDVRASGTRNKWSPDSRMLAAAGVINGSPRALLYVVSVPAGHVTVLDSVDVLATHEFSWSPDARWIVYSRPTELDSGENPIAADLWIADVATGETWPLIETPETVELNPLWISEHSIQIDRHNGTVPEATQAVVIEVKKQGRE